MIVWQAWWSGIFVGNTFNAVFQGDEKVLVTGPWYSQSADYQILFDGCGVATTLVQSGVLRCYTPGIQI